MRDYIHYDDDGNMISVYINNKDELLNYDIKNRLTSCRETLYTYYAEDSLNSRCGWIFSRIGIARL